MKSKQNKDAVNCTGVISVEYDTELSWLIEQDVAYHEKQIGLRRNLSYKCFLQRIEYLIITNQTGSGLIGSRQDNDVTDRTCVISTEYDT